MLLFLLPALATELDIPFEQFTLDNGLTVVLHEDRSDPIVAVATLVHVGSAREEVGRTGFAHFFEHMAFNDSENVPRGANRKRIGELGGSRNGGTSNDWTIYYEVVPSDSLDKILWIDSDRLGYMINTVTTGALENEKQVVKNEKRERVDNAPYGHTDGVISAALWGEGHPYSWSVIGSLPDLQAATLEDVRSFYDQYYGPNNATLVIAGDFDADTIRERVTNYFGEIPRGPEVLDAEPVPSPLRESISLHHLDKLAKLPELRIVVPTVEDGHEDKAALRALGSALGTGKRAPLRRLLVDELGIAQEVSARQYSRELAGSLTIRVVGKEGVDTDELLAATEEALETFAAEGVEPRDLDRIKALAERRTYEGLGTVLDKAWNLAQSAEMAGDPGAWKADLIATQAVSREDVARVFRTYLHEKPRVMTSFVPADSPELVLEGSATATVHEEQVVQGAEAPPAENVLGEYERTETAFDRATEPPFGPASEVDPPQVMSTRRADGMVVRTIEQLELPLVEFSIRIDGGHRTEPAEQGGMTSLLADTLSEGTRHRTPEELADAIGQLGASIWVSGGSDALTLQGNCRAKDFEALFAIAAEMIAEPRFDSVEFERLKARRLAAIVEREGSGRALASLAYYAALYGDHPYGSPTDGTAATIEPLTVKDLKRHHKRSFRAPEVGVQAVGAVSHKAVVAAAAQLGEALRSQPSVLSEPGPIDPPEGDRTVFVDLPGSKQSVIMAGRPTLPGAEAYELEVATNRLGGGSSARLFQTLRIDKGYTYGAYGYVARRVGPSPLTLYSSVRANVTAPSLTIMADLFSTYADTFTAEDLEVTQTLMNKSGAVKFESASARLSHLEDLEAYDLPDDELSQRQARLASFTLSDVDRILSRWYDPSMLIWVVVGDGTSQLSEVEGVGRPVRTKSPAQVNHRRMNP